LKTILLGSAAALALTACTTTTAEVALPSAAAAPAAVSQDAVTPMPDNVLLADWTGPYGGVPPWDKVKPEQFDEAIQYGIDELKREAAAIANNPAAPTFDNTIAASDKTGERLGQVGAVFGVMTDNMSTPAYEALDKKWSPLVSAA